MAVEDDIQQIKQAGQVVWRGKCAHSYARSGIALHIGYTQGMLTTLGGDCRRAGERAGGAGLGAVARRVLVVVVLVVVVLAVVVVVATSRP